MRPTDYGTVSADTIREDQNRLVRKQITATVEPTTTIMAKIFSIPLFLGITSFPPHLRSTVVLVDNSDKVSLIANQAVF
jgi:hypothetical protein